MRQWFTIKKPNNLEWDKEREEFRRYGTLFDSSTEAYDVAVELPFEGLRIELNTDLGGAIRTSTVWSARQ